MHNIIKNKFKFIFLFFLITGVLGCQKDEIQPVDYFSLNIDKSSQDISTGKANILKGITVLAAYELETNKKSTIVITIHGDTEGIYKQEYDYKTNVSITQCALTYKIMSKAYNNEAQYYASFEGFVNISEIDRKNKKISGSYSFKVRPIPETKNIKEIKGKFINISYI